MKIGRPSGFTQDIADEICRRMADGASLRSVCAADDMPVKSTVMLWLRQQEGFSDQYATARELMLESYADDIIHISDVSRIGWKTTDKADGTREVVTSDMVDRARLQIDARKWILSKLAPKKYGDKLDLNHSGSIARPAEEMTEAELMEIARGKDK